MGRPSMRITVQRLMVFVAVMGLAFAAYRVACELQYSTMSYGRNTSVLPIGLKVWTIEDVRSDELTIPAGSRGVVVSDPPDEDSAYPDRLVGVRFSKGPGSGIVLGVKRTSLRAY